MKKLEELFALCESYYYTCEVFKHPNRDIGLEITNKYTGCDKIERIFITDGHLSVKKAIKKTLKFMRNHKRILK